MKIKKIQVTVTSGKSYGHVPGHHYHDVEVSIERKPNGRWMVDILETWGNNQGYDEEQGKRQVIGRDATLDAAVERATLLGSAAAEGLGDSVCRVEAERPALVIDRLLEYRLSGEFDIEGDAGVRQVALRGIADRIDLLEDGTFRVIDYKLGRAPDPGRALQLPIYAVCAGQELASRHDKDWELAEAGYIAFGGPKRFVPMASQRADRDAVIHEAQVRVIRAVDGMARGEFPPRPAALSMCNSCPYSGVCRKDYVGDT